jgi:hypothetical protein
VSVIITVSVLMVIWYAFQTTGHSLCQLNFNQVTITWVSSVLGLGSVV